MNKRCLASEGRSRMDNLVRRSMNACLVLGLAVVANAATAPASAREICETGVPEWQPGRVEIDPAAGYVEADGRIRIVGYNDMSDMLSALAQAFTQAHPQVRFDLILKGTRTAPPALTSGQSLFAPMGAHFTPADLAAFRQVHGREPLLFNIAHDSLSPAALSSPQGIYVHPSNPLSRISVDQARRIFTQGAGAGQITRWGQLGLGGAWADRPIAPAGLGDPTAIGQLLLRTKFAGRKWTDNFTAKLQSRDLVAHVADRPDAIAFANLNHANPRVKLVPIAEHEGGPYFRGTPADIRSGRYPFDRHLLVYLPQRRDGSVDSLAREWMNLILSCQGQQIIAQGPLGYLPLNPAEIRHERRKLPAPGFERSSQR